jgi:hypothetical protein
MTIWADTGAALRLDGEVQEAHEAVDRALGVLYQGLPGASKLEALESYLALRDKVDALGAQILTSVEMTQEHRHEGHGSVVAWAKTHHRTKGPDVARLQRLAHRLRDLPRTETALRRGTITADHVEVLHRAYRLVGPAAYAAEEQALVDTAEAERFVDFEQTVDYFIVRAAPADADERNRRNDAERYASSSSMGAFGGKVDAQFEPIGYAVWQAELERNMDQLLEDDRAEARDRLGRAPRHRELRRTTRQRRVDAMVQMARRSSLHQGDGLGPAPFCVNVHADAAFLTALIAVLGNALDPDGDPDFDLDTALDQIELTEDSMHELDDGTVITTSIVMLALLTGTVRGILYDPAGEVLRYGRDRRLFSPAQRLLGMARSRRCAHPYGCDRTGPSTQTDHRHEHQDGGPTDSDNADRYCRPHNLWKTNHRGEPPPAKPDLGHRRTPRRPGRKPDQTPPAEAA